MSDKVAIQSKIRVRVPRRFRVLLHNDDETPMDFVVEVLVKVFHLNDADAVALMLSAHEGDTVTVGIYSRDMALTRVNMATRMARSAGYPLRLTAEPE